MFEPVEMFTVICDGCGADIFKDSEFEYCCMSKESCNEEISEQNWEEIEDNHYCPNCYEENEDGDYIPKVKTDG